MLQDPSVSHRENPSEHQDAGQLETKPLGSWESMQLNPFPEMDVSSCSLWVDPKCITLGVLSPFKNGFFLCCNPKGLMHANLAGYESWVI